jgi:DNA (cytosine-5)-methyltransferase 1
VKAVSLFSGVGGFEVGFDRAGIDTVLQVESDPWCRQVLARHYPNTPRLEDVRDLDQEYATALCRRAAGLEGVGDRAHAQYVRDRRESERGIDLVYGGFPCQDVSVAGRRGGLAGERSGLWFEFRRILSLLQPRWAIVENTPGLLSSNHGDDFRTVLEGLVELGYSVSWSVLDAQFFGIPQRRRRLFLVAGPRARSTEQVLALCPCCDLHAGAGRDSSEVPAGASVGYLDGHDGSYRGAPGIARTLTTKTRFDPEEETFVSATGLWLRRLTPLERDRCMGWPDDYTALGANGKPVPETTRIKMTGNGMASPVAQWLGQRLVAVDKLLT